MASTHASPRAGLALGLCQVQCGISGRPAAARNDPLLGRCRYHSPLAGKLQVGRYWVRTTQLLARANNWPKIPAVTWGVTGIILPGSAVLSQSRRRLGQGLVLHLP